ncbi:MAG: thioesterase family protein [Pseudomonadales bacterium]|nr:thioesterase family protein [Pseudomonadales bacterium]
MKKNSFTEILANARSDGNDSCYFITDNWLQGRTMYGGLSAALCLHAANRHYESLPPLRSALFSFTGPAKGEVRAKVRMLRQGKSVSFVEVELHGDKGLATHVVLSFGAARASRLDKDFTQAVALPERDKCLSLDNPAKQPVFAAEFETYLAEGDPPLSGSDKHKTKLWIRHRDEAATDLVALLGVADMPPPAVLQMFETAAPVSSMTWSMNFLLDDFNTADRWWLLESIAEHARDGYSSQDMQVWNSDGQLVISARQNVAVFY